ncbi:hypothetical protein T484DRAFT_1669739 [Baffinella frigidus]|nr:hypothetical protein T484DRAFT_1669739 [Cryptophyta sp. CCMP2293]
MMKKRKRPRRRSYSRAEDLRLPAHDRPPMVEGTYVDMALDQVHNFCRGQIKKNKLHYMGVVLFNADNPSETNDMKKGTVEIIELTKPNITCVDTLDKLLKGDGKKADVKRASSEPEGGHCHLHNALKAGQTMINGFPGSASNKFTKNIIVLTNNKDPIGSGANSSHYKAECLRRLDDVKTHGINVEVVNVLGEEEMEDDDWWAPFYEEMSKMFEDPEEEERAARRAKSFDDFMSQIEGGDKNTRSGQQMKWKISATQTIPVKFYSLVQPVPKPKSQTREKEQLREVETTTTHTCATLGAALMDSVRPLPPLNPQPSTLNPQLSTLNPQPSTLNPTLPPTRASPSTLPPTFPAKPRSPKPTTREEPAPSSPFLCRWTLRRR